MINLASSYISAKNKLANKTPFCLLANIALSTPMKIACNASDDIVWNGSTWAAFPMEVGVFRQSRDETPKLTVNVCNINRIPQAHIELANGGVDTEVTFYVVYLGDLTETAMVPTYNFIISSASASALWVTFTLGVNSPINKAYPKRLMLKNFCGFRFPHSKDPRCPYEGITYDSCNRTLADCELRNGADAHRFGAFQSIGANQLYA